MCRVGFVGVGKTYCRASEALGSSYFSFPLPPPPSPSYFPFCVELQHLTIRSKTSVERPTTQLNAFTPRPREIVMGLTPVPYAVDSCGRDNVGREASRKRTTHLQGETKDENETHYVLVLVPLRFLLLLLVVVLVLFLPLPPRVLLLLFPLLPLRLLVNTPSQACYVCTYNRPFFPPPQNSPTCTHAPLAQSN